MKECDILGGSKHAMAPSCIFSGVRTSQPQWSIEGAIACTNK